MSNRLYNQFSYSPERQPINLMGKFTQSGTNVAAELINQGVTYTSVAKSADANDITIRLIVPAGDSALIVAVTGNAIVVTLEKATGVVLTDADGLVYAINADVDASALVTASGSGSDPLVALATTNLAGGETAQFISNAMNMSIVQASEGNYLIRLEDEFPEILSAQVSLMSSASPDLMPQLVSAATAFGTAKQVAIRMITISSQTETDMADGQSLFVHLILRNSSN